MYIKAVYQFRRKKQVIYVQECTEHEFICSISKNLLDNEEFLKQQLEQRANAEISKIALFQEVDIKDPKILEMNIQSVAKVDSDLTAEKMSSVIWMPDVTYLPDGNFEQSFSFNAMDQTQANPLANLQNLLVQ